MGAKHNILFILLLLIPSFLHADTFNNCGSIFFNRPLIVEDKVITNTKNTIQLCNTNYAVLYSTISKTPLYSYEKEEQEIIRVKRDGVFKQDNRIPLQFKATLNDYKNTGYDKGHLTPSGDMNTTTVQQETFLLSNIAPQAPKLNQGAWKTLESNVLPYRYKVTGVLFNSPKITTVGNSVYVPSHFYKIVSNGTCTKAFIAENTNTSKVLPININDLNKLTNIDFNFPISQCD